MRCAHFPPLRRAFPPPPQQPCTILLPIVLSPSFLLSSPEGHRAGPFQERRKHALFPPPRRVILLRSPDTSSATFCAPDCADSSFWHAVFLSLLSGLFRRSPARFFSPRGDHWQPLLLDISPPFFSAAPPPFPQYPALLQESKSLVVPFYRIDQGLAFMHEEDGSNFLSPFERHRGASAPPFSRPSGFFFLHKKDSGAFPFEDGCGGGSPHEKIFLPPLLSYLPPFSHRARERCLFCNSTGPPRHQHGEKPFSLFPRFSPFPRCAM